MSLDGLRPKESEPSPDPSLATLRALQADTLHHETLVAAQLEVMAAKLDAAERESSARRDGIMSTIGQRLDSMDKASDLLAADLRKVPSDLQVAITSLTALEDVKFAAVRAQADSASDAINARFELLDKQTVREKAAADLALAAAFDAQKEAAAAQNNANAEAIRKSELATAETIKTNAEAQRAGQQSLSDKIDDSKDRLNQLAAQVTAIQTARSTAQESRVDQRGGIGSVVGVIGVALVLLSIIVSVAVVILTR